LISFIFFYFFLLVYECKYVSPKLGCWKIAEADLYMHLVGLEGRQVHTRYVGKKINGHNSELGNGKKVYPAKFRSTRLEPTK
jgi:hypothetical protein